VEVKFVAMRLLDLGDNGLEGVLLCPLLTIRSLGRMASSCKEIADTVNTAAFLRRLTAAHGFPLQDHTTTAPLSRPEDAAAAAEDDSEEGNGPKPEFFLSGASVHSLAALSVLSSMRDLKSNHIIFHLASLRMTHNSKKLLEEYANLLKRYPLLQMRLDSHTGVGAPPPIAPQHSVQRACVVARQLVHLGVPLERVEACAWGMDVGRAQHWPASQVCHFTLLSIPCCSVLQCVAVC